MNKYLSQVFIVIFFWGCPSFHVNAQIATPWDVATAEAFISAHKAERPLLASRAVLEEGINILHGLGRDVTKDYETVNIELEKYTKAFDVINIIYASLSTAFDVKNTVDTSLDVFEDYKELLSDYNDIILSRGKVEPVDTMIVTINYKTVKKLVSECEDLWKDFGKLAAYASGKIHCTPAQYINLTDKVAVSLEDIRKTLTLAYFQTYQYIKLRTHYWKSELIQNHPMQVIADDALSKWKIIGIQSFKK